MIEQDLLNGIIQDTSIGGKYSQFYEMLQEELERYTDKRIEDIKEALKYVHPKISNEIDSYDKMRVLYEYSLLL
jgi:LPS O-antigen subunit length determinant protein (WzzB/FepE family)